MTGVTLTGVPDKAPGFHTYVVPATVLVALKEDVPPLQIVDGVAVGVTTGAGFIVIVLVAVTIAQPPDAAIVLVIV